MGWGTTGAAVDTSKGASGRALYNDFGIVVRQVSVVTTTETRGLTEEAAKALVGVTDETTAQSYCRVINGELVTITARTGTKTTKTAGRADESNQWKVSTTVETLTVTGLDGWAEAGTGTTAGTDVVSTHSKNSSILYSNHGVTVRQLEDTVEHTIKNLTQSAAEALVSCSDTTDQQIYYKVVEGDLVSLVATTGTIRRKTSARETNGTYTVTDTTTTYTVDGLGTDTDGWKTAFTGTGVEVTTSKQIASSILFSKRGAQTIYHVETEVVTEYRGAGVGILDEVVFSDNTSQAEYWAMIDGTVYAMTVTSGTRTTWSASRNAKGVWTGVKRVVTFTSNPATIPSPWGTTKLDSDGRAMTLSSSGVSHTTNLEMSHSYEWAVADDTLITTVKRKDTAVEFIDTEAHANAVVAANTSNTLHYRTVSHLLYTFLVPVYASRMVPVGVVKTASASYNSVEKGWTVTIIETTYDWTGTGWSGDHS